MKAVGVIVEYNPFHNGHYYHLQETIKQSEADIVIAVMSGQFLQRGEPALVSKWARTKMALFQGIDLVLELPYLFATQNANIFANGAISILAAIHCTDICFGSENGTIDNFQKTYEFLATHEEAYKNLLKKYLKDGMSYPKATSLAYSDLNPHNSFLDLAKPNNILGYYYVKAIHEITKGRLHAKTILRKNADYHDQAFNTSSIASATSIRKKLFETKELADISQYIPESTKMVLENYLLTYQVLHDWEKYFPLLKYKLLTLSKQELSEICEIDEGIENRLKDSIVEATSFYQFIEKVKTKRYTWTRIQRMCLHVLTHTFKKDMEQISPSYIRLLGMNTKGQKYLNEIKKKIELPLVANVASIHDPVLQLDIKATNTYGMILPNELCTKFIKQEYSLPPIRYNEETKEFFK